MIPSAFVWLDSLPLTRHGKVDRRALPAPEANGDRRRSGQAPRTAAECQLAAIWSAVLGVKDVSADDNFFELGGDSILSIQVVARANAAGLRITPRQIFQNPTLEALAAVAGAAAAVEAEQGMVEGLVPLTPIQRWFFEQDLAEPNHYNQSVLLEVRRQLSRETLERALDTLAAHHDALRLRFRRTAGGWEQTSIAAASVPLDARPDDLQAGLDISEGPLIRAAYFEPGRLLIAIHHLAVDGVSWRILLEDLARLCGGETALPRKTSSYRQWALALEDYARTPEVQAESEYWAAAAASTFHLPCDFEGGENTEASARAISVALDQERTRALIEQVPAAYHTEINDVLLSALWKVLAEWTGERAVVVGLEGHGREEIAEGLDLSRTVGWFTSLYPVRLEAAMKDWPDGVLKQVKEQLRRVPRRGVGYGVLRYLARDERLAGAAEPEAGFNYLGRFDRGTEGNWFALAGGERGPERSARNRRDHLLDISAAAVGGELRVSWSYCESFHRRETIERLAASYLRALEDLVAHCRSPRAGGHTPSDFPLARLDQKKLDRLLARTRQAASPGGRT
jgi:non-ribosomal peptide synthase protein (TIGR01720 family)